MISSPSQRMKVPNKCATVVTSVLLLASVSRSLGEEALSRPLPSEGWSTPSPVGWTAPVLSSSIISMSGSLSANGQGSAGSSHAENVAATGARNDYAKENSQTFFYFARDF